MLTPLLDFLLLTTERTVICDCDFSLEPPYYSIKGKPFYLNPNE